MAPPADIQTADKAPDEPIHAGNGSAITNVAPAERLASGLAGAALTAYAISKRRDLAGAAIALAGGVLLHRSITGHCMVYGALHTGTNKALDSETAVIPHGQGIKVTKVVTIAKSPEELYSFWRNFENLPKFMAHLESVEVIDARRSHWVAKAPFGKSVAWDAEIVNEVPNEMIAWRSVEPADVPNTGSVWFKALPAGRGTEVKVTLEYNPPAGLLGAAVAKFFGEEPGVQVRDDLLHFKSLLEAGEIPTVEGQPQGAGKGRTKVDKAPGVGHAPERAEKITSFDETAYRPA
jgi:uncharacterized membrane protein